MIALANAATDGSSAGFVADVIDRVSSLDHRAAHARQALGDKLIAHKQYIARYGEDLPEIRNWKWKTTNRK